MKKGKKNLLRLTGVILLVFLLLNYDLIRYGLSQGAGQLKILRNAEPVTEFLADPSVPASMKDKLKLVEEIRRFAFDSLGLKYSNNYTTVYDQKGKEVLWVVTACEPFRLKAKTWNFPLIGSFSYKGFFNEKKARDLENKLKEEGYDTSIRNAGGWSTLGWFKDPVMSGMLHYDDGDLAEIIIHELTHGTLFVKDSLKFNENLASFIGEKGAQLFLKYKYGKDSRILKDYREKLDDEKLLTQHILRGADYLDSLYSNMDELPVDDKQLVKQEAIERIIHTADTLHLHNGIKYRKWLRDLHPNNTFFMSYMRYRGNMDVLERDFRYKYKGKIALMIKDYKEKYGK